MGQFRTPSRTPFSPWKGYSAPLPRRPTRICRGPICRDPALLQTLIPLSSDTATPSPHNRLRPRGSPSTGRRLRRSAPPSLRPRARPASPASPLGCGDPALRGPGAPAQRVSGAPGRPGLLWRRGAGDLAGPWSRSPSPRWVAGPAARGSAPEGRLERAQPGPPLRVPPSPARPSPAPAAALALPSSGEPSPPSPPWWRARGESEVAARGGGTWARRVARARGLAEAGIRAPERCV